MFSHLYLGTGCCTRAWKLCPVLSQPIIMIKSATPHLKLLESHRLVSVKLLNCFTHEQWRLQSRNETCALLITLEKIPTDSDPEYLNWNRKPSYFSWVWSPGALLYFPCRIICEWCSCNVCTQLQQSKTEQEPRLKTNSWGFTPSQTGLALI